MGYRYAVRHPFALIIGACLMSMPGTRIAYAQTYQSANLAERQPTDFFRRLQITLSDGTVVDAPKLPNQIGFDQAFVSPDGSRVGWLAMVANHTTNYPIPRSLVIFRKGHIERKIERAQGIFGWRFTKDGKHVAFWTSALHGENYKFAEVARLASGASFATYLLPGLDLTTELKAAPAWVLDIPGIDRP